MDVHGRTKKKRVHYDLMSFRHLNISKKKLEMIKILQQDEVNLVSIEDCDTVLDITFENVKFSKEDVIELLEMCFDYETNAKNERVKVLHVKIADRMRNVVDLLIKYKAKINRMSNLITHYFIEDEYNKFWKQQFTLDDAPFEISGKELLERTTPSLINWLLSNGCDFDFKNKNGQSALESTIACKLLYILPNLLKHTNDIGSSHENSMTLLHSFFRRNDSNKREFLVQPDKVWYSNYTKRYATDIVKIFLVRGVAVDEIDVHGKTALQLAIERKEEIYLIKLLLEQANVNQKNNFGETLFFEVMKKFTSRNDPEPNYYMDILRLLGNKGADVNCENKNGMRPIQEAVARKSLSAVKFLRDNDAAFNVTTKDGKNLLHLLAEKSNKYTLEEKSFKTFFNLLVLNGVYGFEAADDSGDLPLHIAAKTGNYSIVRKLIDLGVNVDCRNNNDKTPLHYAVENREAKKVVKLLLDQGANINSKSCELGRRALCLATAIPGNSEIIQILLKRGSHVNARDVTGQTALHVALENRGLLSAITVQLLVKYGADINGSVNFNLTDNESIQIFLIIHWIKLKTANLLCSKDYESYAVGNLNQCIYQECLIEIERLKITYIDNRTSLYHWLHMDPNSRCFRINNEKLKEIVSSSMLEKQFPKYAILILAYYREAVARKTILQSAINAWYDLTNVDLPDICVNLILAHLNNADLLDMIEED